MTLDILIQLAHGLAEHFGTQCEIAIHDVTRDLSNTIVYIENGQISGRAQGDAASNVVLEALHTPPEELKDQIGYLTRSSDGKALKSSSIYIRDRSGNLRYIFSVNYDISSLKAVDELIRGLITTHPATDQSGKAEQKKQESAPRIPHTVTELLDSLIEHALAEVGKPVVMMTKEDKIRVVRYLNDAGAFLITKSGDRIASVLGISKFTLYKYMESGTP
ncbi:MAG TPA: helix-turn-helix transcriptional regulator [Candidatus Mediterraneibacter excrementigallinarum]|nr:helix-turn-helix transcriptional regulator [Candidatus Mediterraneibacter excrementigallinarum]